jgi:membrane protein DedA with SNARE-associated domain
VILAGIVDVANSIGYPLLFALVAMESMGVPLPGETALITAALVASRGNLDITTVIALAAIAAIIGDNVGYLIGRHGGRRLLEAAGPFERSRRRVLAIGEPFFERHGAKAVFLGRWTAGLRIWAAWLAGATRMPWPTFLAWNALGGVAWAASVGLLAYWLGEGAKQAIETAGVIGGVGIVAGGLAAWGFFHLRRKRRETDAPESP